MNLVSVRGLRLLRHSRKHFWKFCFTHCSMVEEITALLPWCSLSSLPLSLFSFRTHVLEISPEEEVLWLGTLVPMNIEVPTKYQLSHNDRIVVFENRLHNENPMLYRPALHGNWNTLSFVRRAFKDKFPTPTIPLTTVLPNRQVFLPDPV
jgi:hypothetical protein